MPNRKPVLERTTDAASPTVEQLLDANAGSPARAQRVWATAKDRSFEEVTRHWGDLPIRDAVPYGERATHDAGLALVDAPSQFEEAATALAAAGAQVVVNATADGIPTGHPVVPVLKVTGDAQTVAAMPDDIDIDATESDLDALTERLRQVADGEDCAAERHGVQAFAVTRVGPSL
jgi:altronate dehydratase large subunit